MNESYKQNWNKLYQIKWFWDLLILGIDIIDQALQERL